MIIIIGDSWGVGEWDKDCNISGPGLGQYLMLHDRVVNLSVGAGSNTHALDRLSQFLQKYRIDNNDTIYWIVTCPSRDIEINQCLIDTGSLKQKFFNALSKSLDATEKIGDLYDTKINLIGGLCDLIDIDMCKYQHLNLSVPSWGRLLDKHYAVGAFYPESWNQIGQLIRKHYPQHLTEWIEIADMITAKNQSWSKIFHTDGSHPDRVGHKILHNYLYPDWAWKIS